MKIDEQEVARGLRWFTFAGAVALAFAAALFTVDENLSNSPRERKLGQALYELRTAQSTLPVTRSVDDRLHE